MPKARQASRLIDLERVFKALSDRTRLRILGLLAQGEVCVCHIHESLRIPQPRASRHLAYLRRAGLVDTRRKGLWVYYRLSTPSDQASAALRATVMEMLGDLDEAHRDAVRLRAKMGVTPPPADEPAVVCCDTPAKPLAGAADAVR